MDAYGGRFESVFVILHPFVRVPERLAWSATRQYPSDAQIAAVGAKCSWMEVSERLGISSCARMNQALLTSSGSLAGYLADSAGSHAMRAYLESQPVWMPAEGRFEPLLRPDFLSVFDANGADALVFVPEFPNSDPPVRLSIAELRDGSAPFPSCGTLVAPDASFLFTVDWDSFFTLFYGSRALVAEMARRLKLDGFFATQNTEHAWWNYSLGCATVTVSPEDWQTA